MGGFELGFVRERVIVHKVTNNLCGSRTRAYCILWDIKPNMQAKKCVHVFIPQQYLCNFSIISLVQICT